MKLSIAFFILIFLLNNAFGNEMCLYNPRERFDTINRQLLDRYEKIDPQFKVNPDNLPIWKQGKEQNRKVFVLVHGFMGAPREMAPIFTPFGLNGGTVISLLIPGHAANNKIAGEFHYQDFAENFKAHMENIVACFDEIHLLGFSTGGLIIYNYLLENNYSKKIKTVQFLSPYFLPRVPVFMESLLVALFDGINVDTAFSITRFPDLEVMQKDREVFSQFIPFRLASEIKKFGELNFESQNPKRIDDIRAQVYLSAGDWTADINSSEQLLKKHFSSISIKKFDKTIPHHIHVPAVSEQSLELSKMVDEFISL